MSLIRMFSQAVVVLVCAALAACGGGSSGSNDISDGGGSSSYANRIHMLVAASGELALDENPGGRPVHGTLTLRKLHKDALWYADRPHTESGRLPLSEYLGNGWLQAYEKVNPNATLQFHPQGGTEISGLYLTLSRPLYDQATDMVSFQVRVLNDTVEGPLSLSMAFSNVSLNILNNAEDDVEVSSYVQYAAQASLQPGANGRHVLMMTQASENMFWVDNAPGTYSDSRPMSQFFSQWPHVFADGSPNAALVGTTASGAFKVYFLTLDMPEYDADSGVLRYAVSLLGEQHGALESINQAVLLIDSGTFSRFPFPGKGTAYQAFGAGYDPSTSNTTYLYFGSDIARRQMGSLWGTQSYLSQSCEPSCRNDMKTIKDMGINLIRLYDWDPRNDHSQFLDHAHDLGIKVVVPISNWLPTQGPDTWDKEVPNYFRHGNFGNRDNNDWHPAIAGVIISNELDQEEGGRYYQNAIGLVERFLQEADALKFSKSVPVGVPVTFAKRSEMPSWQAFDQLVNDPRMASYRSRLMLCPQTYNDATYLFVNAEGTGKGWVQQTWERYQLPILFTEIGASRTNNPDSSIVRDQLRGAIEYQNSNPQQLIGAIHFQFDNKVWKQTPGDTDPEGAFGAFRHGDVLKSIPTVRADYEYDIWEANNNFGTLNIDRLEPTVTHGVVVEAYR